MYPTFQPTSHCITVYVTPAHSHLKRVKIHLLITVLLLAGNLTKHMKSKAHSKKCLEMGVPELLIEDQDAEDSGTERQKKTNQLLLYSKLINSQGSNVLFS